MKLKEEKDDKKREAEFDENLYKYLGIKRTKKEQRMIDNWNYANRTYVFEDGKKITATFEDFRDVEEMKTFDGDDLSEKEENWKQYMLSTYSNGRMPWGHKEMLEGLIFEL